MVGTLQSIIRSSIGYRILQFADDQPVNRRRPTYTAPVADSASAVADRIRREREKAGLSLAQLSAVTGLSKTYLVRLENRDSNPSLDVLGRIADALQVTVADLVGGPVVRFEVEDAEIAPSLRAFVDEAGLTTAELGMLASIRWRRGEEPRTPERWRYIYESLRLSRSIDERKDAED